MTEMLRPYFHRANSRTRCSVVREGVLKDRFRSLLAETPLFGESSLQFGYLAFGLANYLAKSRFVVFAKVVASSVPVAVCFELFRLSCDIRKRSLANARSTEMTESATRPPKNTRNNRKSINHNKQEKNNENQE